MGLLNTIRFIIGHPLNAGHRLYSLGRFADWQVRSRLASGPIIVDFAGGTKLLVSRGQTGATGNLYAGLHELPEMAFVLHFLRPGDLFVDVGANVGSYTILAAGAAGASCISFEPAPPAFRALLANISLNELGALADARQLAVGDAEGEAAFTSSRDTLNHIVTGETTEDVIVVPVTTLDSSLAGRDPVLVKIDVEGFEANVLAGARNTLAAPTLGAVIMETNGSGSRYASSVTDLHAVMSQSGFIPCDYDAFTRSLTARQRPSETANTIYVRDVTTVAERVRSARKFEIPGRSPL